MSSPVPYKNARLIVLNLTSVFATVAACIGLNALVRSNQQKTALKARVAPPTRIQFDTTAIQNPAIVATAGNVMLGSIAFLASSITLLPAFRSLANKTLRLQAGLIAFFAVWIVACMIPVMIEYTGGSTGIKAFIGTTQLPDSLVQATVAKSGHSPVYKDMWFLRLLAIFPWLAVGAAIIAVPVLLKAARAVDSSPKSPSSESESEAKETIETSERV